LPEKSSIYKKWFVTPFPVDKNTLPANAQMECVELLSDIHFTTTPYSCHGFLSVHTFVNSYQG